MTTIDALELLAGLEATTEPARGGPLRAVRLWAAAQTARQRIDYRLTVPGGTADTRIVALRDRLGGEFDRAWTEGTALTPAEAVALARRGRGRRRRPGQGWDSLTPAEQRVALLVGAGLTNPQIAARLFVSPDTVKGHVSAALRKLGVSNRAALAAEATRRGTGPAET